MGEKNKPIKTSKGLWVLYFYPMTGRPNVKLPDGWNEIPGARGCTPQSCSFRDNFEKLKSLNTNVYGISTQTTNYQKRLKKDYIYPMKF